MLFVFQALHVTNAQRFRVSVREEDERHGVAWGRDSRRLLKLF